MIRYFSSSSPVPFHQLLTIGSVIAPKELAERIIEFKELLASTNEAEKVLQKDSNGETILHLIAKSSQFNELSHDLLRKYPKLALIPDNKGKYPVHTAILNQNRDLLELLLPLSADKRDLKDQSIIHYAVIGWPSVLEICCHAARDLINEPDGEGYTPLEKARELKNTKVEAFLSGFEKRVSPG